MLKEITLWGGGCITNVPERETKYQTHMLRLNILLSEILIFIKVTPSSTNNFVNVRYFYFNFYIQFTT